MLGRKKFVQGNKLAIILLVFIAQGFLVVLQVEVGKLYLLGDAFHEWSGHMSVKEIGFGIGQALGFKVFKLFYKTLVLGKQPLKHAHIKDEPFVNIGNDQVFDFKVFMCNALAHIVQHQFVKSFGVELLRTRHFAFIGGLLGFQNHPHGIVCLGSVVNHQVIASLGVDKMALPVIGFFQKIRNQVLVKLFAFGIIGLLKQGNQMGLEPLHITAVGLHLQKGFVKGFTGFQGMCLHVFRFP